ncbi:MAG: M14 family zinc carboxypeptidase, partial [Pyrinomonadaceae bacterium]
MEKNNKRNRTILRDFAASREHSLLTRLAPQAILILPSILLIIMTLKPAFCQDPSQLADYWKQNHFAKIIPSDLSYAGLKSYLDQLRTGGLSVAEVGKSYGGRAIYKMDFGSGPFKIFMWSQMHGDEPTATCALLDLFYFLQQNRHLTLVENISRKITLRAVPMLNPDGAELYQRRNMQGIDINRDAQA